MSRTAPTIQVEFTHRRASGTVTAMLDGQPWGEWSHAAGHGLVRTPAGRRRKAGPDLRAWTGAIIDAAWEKRLLRTDGWAVLAVASDGRVLSAAVGVEGACVSAVAEEMKKRHLLRGEWVIARVTDGLYGNDCSGAFRL